MPLLIAVPGIPMTSAGISPASPAVIRALYKCIASLRNTAPIKIDTFSSQKFYFTGQEFLALWVG